MKTRYLRSGLFQRLMPSSRPAAGARTVSDGTRQLQAVFSATARTRGHEVKGGVGALVVQAGRGAKVLAKAHAPDDVQRHAQRRVVDIDCGARAHRQLPHQLLVHGHHVSKPLPVRPSVQHARRPAACPTPHQADRAHRIFLALKAGATPLRTRRQCASVGLVKMFGLALACSSCAAHSVELLVRQPREGAVRWAHSRC